MNFKEVYESRRKLGSVEEEMDKLESSDALDTSIEDEAANEPKENKSLNCSEMEIDNSSTSKSEDDKSCVNLNVGKTVDIDKIFVDMKTFVSDNSLRSFEISQTVQMKEVMAILEEADNLEMDTLKDFQDKLGRLAEVRKRVRNHAEYLINSK